MIELPLNGRRGGVVLLDDSDDWALLYNWSQTAAGYAQRWHPQRKTMTTLHREVMGFPDGQQVDHINRNRLDNRRSNLRLVSNALNAQNVGPRGHSKTGLRGVVPRPSGRWVAQHRLNAQTIYIGTYDTELEAAEAARNWRRIHMPYATD